jgi:hypothetical protein
VVSVKNATHVSQVAALEHTVTVLKRREDHLISELGRDRYNRVVDEMQRVINDNDLLPSHLEQLFILLNDTSRLARKHV